MARVPGAGSKYRRGEALLPRKSSLPGVRRTHFSCASDGSAVLMTDCNEAVRPVHDRMPVLLQEEDYDLWLRGSLDDVMVSQGRCFPDQLIKLENGGDRADGGPASLSAANAIATNL